MKSTREKYDQVLNYVRDNFNKKVLNESMKDLSMSIDENPKKMERTVK